MKAPVPEPRSAQPADAGAPAAPNQYHLHGGGVAVSYCPKGFGVVSPSGAARLVYQDAHRSLNLTGPDVGTVEVPDLGAVVSIALVRTVDVGSTAFSLVVPRVVLPAPPGAVPLHTEGVTMLHRTFLGAIGQAQRETYTVTALVGTASRGILPL